MILLARNLVRVSQVPWISDRHAAEIIALWDRLPDSDKAAVVHQERFRDHIIQGRNRTSKTFAVRRVDRLKWHVYLTLLRVKKTTILYAFIANLTA